MTLKHTSFCFHICFWFDLFCLPKTRNVENAFLHERGKSLVVLFTVVLFEFSQLNIIQIYFGLSVCFKYPALSSSFLTTDLWTTLTDKEKVRRWPLNNGHLQSSKLGTFPEQRDFPEREFPHSPTSCFVDYGTELINYFCRDSV